MSRLAYVFALLLAAAIGCGDSTTAVGVPPGTGGSGGAGGASGTGGSSGTGGDGGTGAGGIAGSGGAAGAGGSAGGGGIGGDGGASGLCATNALCHTCPTQFLCDTDADCSFSGYACVSSGCETNGGAPIKQCQPSRAPSCSSGADCPNTDDYDCLPVGVGPARCIRVTAGCSPATESFDCAPGFSCEGGACVDRRMPCDSYLDCPKSHVCTTTTNSSYCIRTHRSCREDTDCGGFAAAGSFCADVDNDGAKECVGALAGEACVNADCLSASAPVCEVGGDETLASCGDYGLCLNNNECDSGFVCAGLWQDGRRECVPSGGTCDQVTDCPLQQVCAAPRNGGSPRCQAGKEAM